MNLSFKDYFSTQSQEYAHYRPHYPPALATHLASLCADPQTALDCGCGSGQLSVLLADYFQQVVATDASRAQIAHAVLCRGVTYCVTPAEASGLPTASVDLLTVAQAAHWLDLPAFYAEAARVLKPEGVLALITYGTLHLDDPQCDRLVQDFYHQVISAYWPPERRHVESGYRTLPFPFEEIALPSIHMTADWDFESLFGYLMTWSACQALEKAVGTAPLECFRTALAEAWGMPSTRRTITWPLAIRAAYVNVPNRLR